VTAKKRARAAAKSSSFSAARARLIAAARDDAERAGLLASRRTAHVSIRTTPELLAEAKRRAGVESNTELVELALAALAAPDPVSRYMLENLGALGKDHKLEY
jgi:Arc/MetJ family transcription regulator